MAGEPRTTRYERVVEGSISFFRVRTRPSTSEMIAFIDKYRDRFSVEFICATLNKQRQGGFITLRGYRNAKYGAPSAKSIRGRDLVAKVRQIHAENYGVYDVRKVWHTARRAGGDVDRDQVARITKIAGISRIRRGRNPVITRRVPTAETRPDLVQRR